LPELVRKSLAAPRFYLLLAEILGAAALVLVAAGLYGVTAYASARRTPEIGIRMALGADRRGILVLILRRTLGLALLGTALGLAAALLLTPSIAGLLHGVAATDAGAFALATLFLLLVALAAGTLPARRASRVDPGVALRGGGKVQ
jgi:ABC-type antimicrobial peptide transport system permease subunit